MDGFYIHVGDGMKFMKPKKKKKKIGQVHEHVNVLGAHMALFMATHLRHSFMYLWQRLYPGYCF